jgi:hypothetical protein
VAPVTASVLPFPALCPDCRKPARELHGADPARKRVLLCMPCDRMYELYGDGRVEKLTRRTAGGAQ